MSEREKILSIEIDKVIADLKDKHLSLGMKASGQWLRSLQNESQRLSGKITGLEYTKNLVQGTPPGNFPSVKKIMQWIDDKPIIFDKAKISKKSLAFLISRKIFENGTQYYRQGGTDLLSAILTKKRFESIIEKVGDVIVNEYIIDFVQQLKE